MTEFALFANFENPSGDTRRAFAESIASVVLAEELGYEQVWVTEHHFNPFSVSSSIFALLAHLAARTSRIKLGAGAVLLPFHDPIRVAEDAATLDALSNGRLLLGVARGGPFPDQFRNFGISHDRSAAVMRESLELIEAIFAGTGVNFASEHFHHQGLSVYPRISEGGAPIWLASSSPESLALAAERGYGLMGASAAPVSKFRRVLDDFAALRPSGMPPFVAARYLLCAEDHHQARAEAWPFIRDFGANMRGAIRQIPSGAPLQPFGEPAAAFSEEALLDKAIVGDPAACVEQCLALQEQLAPYPLVLLLKPASYDAEVNRTSLRLFAERVRPQLAGVV